MPATVNELKNTKWLTLNQSSLNLEHREDPHEV